MEEEVYRPWLWKAPEGGVIGKHVQMKDGYEKASGKGLFTRDVYRPRMLYAKFIISPYNRASVKSVDTTKAKSLPGVRDIITYNDMDLTWFETHPMKIPIDGGYKIDTKKITVDSQGVILDPEAYSKTDTANWYGQPIGVIVVADSEQICDEALRLIDIQWEELPWITDPEKALEPNAPVLIPEITLDDNLRREVTYSFGDVEKGFEEAERIIEFKVKHEEMSWAGGEAAVSVAEWSGGDCVEVWHHCQEPDFHGQDALERYTKANKIHLHALHQGGIFGSITHLSVPQTMSMIAAVAAKRTGRPVKVLYDQSHFHGLEEGYGVYYLKVGFKNDGKITALQLHYIGVCLVGPIVNKLYFATGIPNIRCTESVPIVNVGPPGPQRAGGNMCSMVTAVFNHVAGELGMDPTKIALINDGCEGKDMHWVDENVKRVQGFDPTRDSLKEVLEAGKKAIDWDSKWHLPGTKILPNGKYHGIGCMWIQAWLIYREDNRKIGLVLRHDGTISIIARRAETGTHGTSTYPQVVADEAGMRYEDVHWRPYDDPGFDAAPVDNSAGMQRNIPQMVRAARKMKQLLLEYAVTIPDVPRMKGVPALFPGKEPEDLDIRNSEIFEKANPANKKPVAALAAIFSKEIFAWDHGSHNAEKKHHMTRQAYFVEVEVDPDTGETEIQKVVIARDSGIVINPDSCNQQLYGVYMGIGRSNTEAIYRDPMTGVRLNDNLIDYPQFTMNDIGSIEIRHIETGLGYGPYGLIGIGESSATCTSSITGSAIYNAIGKYVDDFPTTPDKVLKALGKV